MGLKSGSRDAGLDESDEQAEHPEEQETTETEGSTETTQSRTTEASSETPTGTKNEGKSGEDRPTMDSIPYKLRREKVNEGREQVPYFLREEIIEAEDELQDTLEELLGEDVYKSDYREAAMVVAQRNPKLVAEVLREWGYDLNPT